MDVSAILWAEYRRLLKEASVTPRDEAVARPAPDLVAESRFSAIVEGFTEQEADEIAGEVAESGGATLSFTPMLQGFAEEIQANARCLGIRVDRPFLIAEYPTGEFNACIAPVRPGAALILVNFGLLMMVFQVAKIQSLSLNFCRSDGEGNRIPGTDFGAAGFTIEQTTSALANTIYAYLAHQDSTRAIRFPVLVGERLNLLDGLLHHCERFIVAHELAHLFCGHLEDSDYRNVAIPGGVVRAYEYLRDMEFEADTLALRCCMHDVEWPSGQMASWIAAGATFLFGLQRLVGKVLSLHRPPVPGTTLSDHPSADDRIAAIRSDVFAKYGGVKVWSRSENLLLWLDSYGDEVVRRTRDILRRSDQ
jgi:hypothetical protein